MKYKEPLIIMLISLIVIFLISLTTLKDLSPATRLSLSYTILFYAPVVFFISTIKEIDILEKTVLTNILGVSYSAIYFIFDVALKIPLTKTLFIVIAILLTLIGFIFYNKNDRSTTNLKGSEAPLE